MTMNGYSAETAVQIESDVSYLSTRINKKLEEKFGTKDGAFFIHSEEMINVPRKGKVYKRLFMETADGKRFNMWFELV